MPLRNSSSAPEIHPQHVVYLHFAYYGSLIAIHSVFTYPWNLASFGSEWTLKVARQVNLSSNIVAEASRNIALITRDVKDINPASPGW
jgi:hypothetical protein